MAATGATPTATTGAHPSQQLSLEAQKILAKPPRSLWSDAWLRLKRNKAAMVSIVFIIILSLVAIFAPLVAPHNPLDQNTSNSFRQAAWIKTDGKDTGSWEWPLGTDNLGRDYLSRMLFGARISLLIGAAVMLISGLIGTAIGMAGGYLGGRTDLVVGYLITTRLALPVVLVALAVVATIGGSLFVVIAVLGLLKWDRFAVVMRSAAQQVRGMEYVAAARAAGASHAQVLLTEVLPNVMPQLIVIATVESASAILLEAALSFLGLGVQPPLPSWGLMVAEAKNFMFFSFWLIAIPAAMLALLVLAINLLGDGLRDVLAPEGPA